MKRLLAAGLLTALAALPMHAAAREMAGRDIVQKTGVRQDIFANEAFQHHSMAKESGHNSKWPLPDSGLIPDSSYDGNPDVELVAEADVLRGRATRVAGKKATSGSGNASEKKQGEGSVPDAMKYIVKGPDIDVESMRDPFASHLSQIAERRRQQLLARQAKLGRRKHEKLEDFDLSELKLVAIMRMGKDRVAMVEDNSGKGYLVHRNNHMGKNGGRVEKITDNSILLIEKVTNPAGDLVEREVRLTLKEVNGQNTP